MPKPKNNPITASAPGKVILFGEHAINRGQPALSAAVGLRATCRVAPAPSYHFEGGTQHQNISRQDVLGQSALLAEYLRTEDYASLRSLASDDYFAPAKYVLTSVFGEDLPDGLEIAWKSEIPSSSGLGSGGAAFTAMVAALRSCLPKSTSQEQAAIWAHRGDIIAHGGIASALDTQTSLLGGVICYTGTGLAEPVEYRSDLTLVIGHTGTQASTGAVNGRVRTWLQECPEARMTYFQAIGTLSRAARLCLAHGDWEELGRLMMLNQLALEKIGVSCPELERLIEAALAAGAFGAKLSGSGGGGIMVALTSPETKQRVADAIIAAGGTAYVPSVGVSGVKIEEENDYDRLSDH